MEKKKYFKPVVKSIKIEFQHHLLNGTVFETTQSNMTSRETKNVWDDEEEEENTGGWFQ